MRQLSLLVLVVIASCARNGGVTETEGDAACDALDETNCLFPFPSDYFRKDGVLAFTQRAMPRNADRDRFVPAAFNGRDGFSPLTPIYFRIPGATLDGAPAIEDLNRSLETQAKTLVIDAETGERVAHWAEFDHFSLDGGDPVIALRLATKLQYQRRYIVAVRGLTNEEGKLIAPSRGFKALRDRTPSTLIGIDERRDRFIVEIFRPLEKIGVARNDLQLAFDFTTGSEDAITRDMYATVERGLAALPAGGPAFTVTNVEDYAEGPIARMITGTLQVPSVLEPGSSNERRHLRRGDDGLPKVEGTEAITFDLQIPRSVLNGTQKAAVIQYGHGLLGRRAEAYGFWIRAFADRKGFLILDLDMQGMTTADLEIWVDTFRTSMGELPLLADKAHQGVLNHLVATRMMKTSMLAVNTLYDPNRVYYYGNSQGGTMGALITTLSPDLERSVLGVPGGAFAFLLSRSVDFAGFALVVQSAYPDVGDFLAIMGLVQTGFDRMDPANYAQHLTEKHSALLHVAKEDAQVDNQVSELMGRVVNVPAAPEVWSMETLTLPHTGSAYVRWDFGRPERPATNRPVPKENDTHETLRRHVPAQDQLWNFLETGVVQ